MGWTIFLTVQPLLPLFIEIFSEA